MTQEELNKIRNEELNKSIKPFRPRTQKEIKEYQINYYEKQIKIKKNEIKNMKEKIKFLKMRLTQFK